MVQRAAALFVVIACACGGSSRRSGTPRAASADDRELQAIEAMKPASPYVTKHKTGYRATERCGQAHRIELVPVSARFSETVRVRACSPRKISGNYKLTTTYSHGHDSTTERAFGDGRDNAACVASAAERAAASTHAVDAGAAAPATGGKRGGKRAVAAVAPPAPAPDRLVATPVPSTCTTTEHIIDHTWISEDGVPLEPGGKLTIDLWSDAPNDLEGVVFVVEQLAVAADMTAERWAAYRAADKAYSDRMNAYVDRRVAAGTLHYVDNTVKAPPPPPKKIEVAPPKPSLNASWVPGSWYRDSGSYHWSAGFWRVPESDIEKELTVKAPEPPPAAPPPKVVEAPRPPPPTAAVVWAPGQWQWDGRAYVWVDGAWRVPPTPQHTWRPDAWIKVRGGVRLSPGGWTIPIGR